MVADRDVLDAWWQAFVATARLPAELGIVQQRLVRAVGRGLLPSGPVYVKVMTFPRPKDRLRYCLRALPAAHEASMLRAVAAAGLPCPEVVDVRTQRRALLPSRSFLVLRSLPVQIGGEAVAFGTLLRDEADVAMRLLRAGIVHRDLHSENFVRLVDGRLAVLDLQSAQCTTVRAADSAPVRLATAARLLRERELAVATAASLLLDSGLLRNDGEVREVVARVDRERRRFQRSRIMRCLQESTEFERAVRAAGVEHRQRGPLPPGRWYRGSSRLRQAWIGQRALQLHEGRPPLFHAFFRKWWWLGGGAALYVPATCSDLVIEAEVQAAAAGVALLQDHRGGREVQPS